jgi:histidyl-tRNA synthetase
MRDFLPAELARRQHVIDVIREVYGRYGFVPLETPTIENLSTLLGKYGEEGDQLLYRILHRRDGLARALAEPGVSQATLADEGLRYDLTVPLARVVAQYELPKYFQALPDPAGVARGPAGQGEVPRVLPVRRRHHRDDQPGRGGGGVRGGGEVLHALGFADFKIRVNHRQLLRSDDARGRHRPGPRGGGDGRRRQARQDRAGRGARGAGGAGDLERVADSALWSWC